MNIELLKSTFLKFDYELSDMQAEKLIRFNELLVEWNKKINLTAIIEPEDVLWKHFVDSTLLLFEPDMESENLTDEESLLYNNKVENVGAFNSSDSFPLCKFGSIIDKEDVRVIDIGTGAGFPGIVLGILKPTWQITLLDSLNKRVDFLNTVISELALENCTAVHGRAEELARDDSYRFGFDLVVSRAVAELPVLLELCMPFVSDDGFFVSYKGPGYEEELSHASGAMSELKVADRFTMQFGLSNSTRVLIGFEHVDSLPDKYPRRAGIPMKRPL